MSDPVVSIIVATYNVAPYLPEFLASLDRQAVHADGVEAVFVNDGSTDRSGDILAEWGRRTSWRHRVITIDNAGVANARNTGIGVARGQWLTFCDPDDVLADDYLAIIMKMLGSKQANDIAAAVGKFVYLDHQTGRLSDTHPLRFRHAGGDRVVDLEREPTFVHLATNTGFYRRSVIEERHIRFDPRIKPVFEDAHFTGVYLASFDRPRIAFMGSAVYRYRRGRADGSSLMQGAWAHEGKFIDVPAYGWLDLLRRVENERGRVPAWVQNVVLYDLFWYLRRDRSSPSPITVLPEATKARFNAILAEIAPYLQRENIEDFAVNKVPLEMRIALAHGLKGPVPGTPRVTFDVVDRDQGLARFTYYFLGDRPAETIRARGLIIEPVHAKIRTHRFVGKVMMNERIGWLPVPGSLSISLDDCPAELTTGPRDARHFTLDTAAMLSAVPSVDDSRKRTVAGSPADPTQPASRGLCARARSASRNPRLALRRCRALFRVDRTRFIAYTPLYRRFANAWLLIDRDVQAQDNAEHLYRYLRERQRSVNAWFVLDRTSPDWDRLHDEGFRLIEHGSREHTMALLNAEHVISSQLDGYITNPPAVRSLRPRFRPQWKFTFLQHGVTKDDLSNWINDKPLRLMITASTQEQAGIVSDYTNYAWTTKEVRLTGFPRHDRLLAMSQRHDPAARTILVMPTWRREMLDFSVGAGSVHPLRSDFWDTSFAKSWQALLTNHTLAEASRRRGWPIVFMPHPLMEDCLDHSPLPDYIDVRRFSDVDIQAMIVGAGVLITDYSSNAFEAAYLQQSVVYFQFDSDTFFSGTHSYTRGSWSYDEDGFGPVTVDVDDAVREVVALLDREGKPDPLYAERMNATFPFRDGRCAERTYQAIRDLTRFHSSFALPYTL